MRSRSKAVAAGAPILLAACGAPSEPKKPPAILEQVEVRGSCRENHAITGANDYHGFLTYQIDTDGRPLIWGLVSRPFDVNQIFAEVAHPLGTYKPPHSINFLDIPTAAFASQRMTIGGLSDSRDSEDEPNYQATCALWAVARQKGGFELAYVTKSMGLPNISQDPK